MLAHDPDRTAGHLIRAARLAWPVPRSLRRAAVNLLEHRGCTVRNPQAPAAVLALGLLVSSLPAADLDAGGRP